MSDITQTDLAVEKQRPAHLFKPGVSGNPAGRPRGSRNRLADAFVADLALAWQQRGVAALEECSADVLIKTVAALLPRSIDINATLNVSDFADRLAQAAKLLDLDIDPPRRRRPLPNQPRIIEHQE